MTPQELDVEIGADALLSAVHDGVIALDANGRITAWNQSARALLGWPEDQALGRTVEDVLGVPLAQLQSFSDASGIMLTPAHQDGQTVAVRGRVRRLPNRGMLFAIRPTWVEDVVASLGFERDLGRLGDAITGWARRLTGGACAALFLRVEGSQPPSFMPQSVAGGPHDAFPRIEDVLPDQLRFEGVLRPLVSAGGDQFAGTGLEEPERRGFPAGDPMIGRYVANALFDEHGDVCGCLVVGDSASGAIREEHVDIVRTLAGQASIAVQNARLYASMQQALRDSETLRFIGQQLAGQVDVPALLNQLVRYARVVLEADLASVASLSGGSTIEWVAWDGMSGAPFAATAYQPGYGIAGRIIASRQPLVVDVTAHREEFSALDAEGVRTAFGVPLLRGSDAFGALVIGYRQDTTVTGHEIALAQALASHASISLENTRLLGEVEQRLAEAEAERRLLRAVLESLPIGLAIAESKTNTITEVNRVGAELLGIPLQGRVVGEALALFDARRPDGTPFPAEELPLPRALNAGETVPDVQLSVGRPDGVRIPLLLNASPVVAADGSTVGGVLAFQDVSHLKEVERLKDEFLSVASHELKTPLTPLLGLTQLMLRGIERGRQPSPEQLEANLQSIFRQATHMSELVNDLLDVSRMQIGKPELHPRQLDMVALISEVIERFQALHTGANLQRIRLQTQAQSIWGEWDRSRIDQVLTNLISNALKYSPGDSEVTVSVATSDASVEVSVHDRGIGVPRAEQARLFEPFFRATNASVRNYPGVGLGLHITREIVRRHGGELTLESDEGAGSVFTVELPLAVPAALLAQPE